MSTAPQQELTTQDPAAHAVAAPPYPAAAAVGLAVFALYSVTLAPTAQFWDASEYAAAAHVLGIPHPPGNPTFVIIARAWQLLLSPTGWSAAVRLNLFSALMSALAHACWFLVVHRILARLSEHRHVRTIGAVVATIISATAFTVWSHSNVNEKVYSVTLFSIALISWLVLRWRDRIGTGGEDNLLVLVGFLLALSVGNHLMAFLAVPAVIVLVLIVKPRTLLHWPLYLGGAVAVVIGLSTHLFLPLRAELAPIVNEADPSCPSIGSAVTSVLTLGRAGCVDLSAALTRRQYGKPSMLSNPVDPAQPRDVRMMLAQLVNYFQYFDWQWARSVQGLRSWFTELRGPFTALFLSLGLVGAATHYQRDRASWAYATVLFLTLSAGLVFYMNFKYGLTVPEEFIRSELRAVVANPAELREGRERDYFFLCSFSVWGLWAGIGLTALWQDVAGRVRQRGASVLRSDLLSAPVLGIALLPLIFNWSWANRSNDYTARDWAYNLLMSVEPYGVLFTSGDNNIFPVWYLQEAEGIRQDVTVITLNYLNTPWYVRQIRDLTAPCPAGIDPQDDPTRIICQRRFRAPPVSERASQATTTSSVSRAPRAAPTRSIVPFTDAEIEAIGGTAPRVLATPRSYDAGPLRLTFPPGHTFFPLDEFMAAVIRAAIDERPIYFAITTAQPYDPMSLHGRLVREGLALRLSVDTPASSGIAPVPQTEYREWIGPFIDVARTETLLSEIFLHRGGFPADWTHWPDVASEGVPFYYSVVYYGLGAVYEERGDSIAARRHRAMGDRFFQLATLRRTN